MRVTGGAAAAAAAAAAAQEASLNFCISSAHPDLIIYISNYRTSKIKFLVTA